MLKRTGVSLPGKSGNAVPRGTLLNPRICVAWNVSYAVYILWSRETFQRECINYTFTCVDPVNIAFVQFVRQLNEWAEKSGSRRIPRKLAHCSGFPCNTANLIAFFKIFAGQFFFRLQFLCTFRLFILVNTQDGFISLTIIYSNLSPISRWISCCCKRMFVDGFF